MIRNPSGKWRFVGAQRLNDSIWRDTPHYVSDLIWEFIPEYIGQTKLIGVIIEHSPKGETTKLPYIFCTTESIINIEIYPTPSSSQLIGIYPNIDAYKVRFDSTYDIPVMTLSVIDNNSNALSNFRYTLQKI